MLILAFRLCRLFPVRKNKVVLLRNFPVWGSLAALEEALRQDGRFRVARAGRLSMFRLATAGAVFLNNNYSLLADLPFSKETKLVQLWHGDGVLKRSGFSLEKNRGARMIPYTAVICGSEAVRPFLAQAFGLPEQRVLPLGSPRIDALVRPCDKRALRARFDERHPECRGKRLFLYAPTFRGDPARNAALLSHFDFGAFRARFGDGAALLVRLHPRMHGAYDLRGTGAVDVTNEPDPADLLRVCERLITDYSSIMTDAAALDLPVVLYAFDYDDYMAGDSGMYTDLKALPPGPVAEDFASLLEVLSLPDDSAAARAAFRAFHLGDVDGKSCERIIERFL